LHIQIGATSGESGYQAYCPSLPRAGEGFFYYLTIASILIALSFSANTALPIFHAYVVQSPWTAIFRAPRIVADVSFTRRHHRTDDFSHHLLWGLAENDA
jgi:hypothetical protein